MGNPLRARFVLLAVAGALLCTVVGLALPSPGPVALAATSTDTAPASDPNATLALITFKITTTSDWTRVYFSHGRLAKVHTVAASGGVLSTSGNKIVLNAVPLTGATAEVRVLYEEVTLQDPLDLVVHKGSRGTTSVTAVNLTSGAPVTDVSNSRRNSPQNEVRFALQRSVVFSGGNAELPHADSRALVLAFYYPWFTHLSYGDPRMADRPVDRSDTYIGADVLAMTQQARSNGIDGFLVSWSGQRDAVAFAHAINAAEATGGVATGYLETLNANATSDPSRPPDPTVVWSRLWGLLAGFGNRPAFLHSGDIPVVFVFGMQALPVSTWKQILDALAAAGYPVRLVGDGSLPTYRPVMWGSHIYNPNLQTEGQLTTANKGRTVEMRGDAAVNPGAAPGLSAATVSPGYEKGSVLVPRGPEGEHYAATWRAGLASDPDWVLVTSWNEWFEGTSVQPGREAGDLALRQTAQIATTFRR
jgi:hypothetical protein